MAPATATASPVVRSLLVLAIASGLSLTVGSGCNNAPAGDPALNDGLEGQPVRETQGTIKSVSEDGKTIVIAHEEIKGFMKAMTMPFTLPDATMGKGLKAGDRVSLSFQMNREGTLVVKTIEAQ